MLLSILAATLFGRTALNHQSSFIITRNVKVETVEFDFKTGEGLTVRVDGMPVIRGSWFQYYAPGWTKGYYSSQWNVPKIERPDGDTIKVTYGGAGQDITATGTFRRSGNTLKVDYEFGYSGSEPALIEFTPGMVWLTPWQHGTVTSDGTVYQPGDAPEKKVEEKDRHIGPDAKTVVFEGPAGEFQVKSDRPILTFDARNYSQDWADGKQLFWQGYEALPAERGRTTKVSLEYNFKPGGNLKSEVKNLTATLRQLPAAILPDESRPVLIPLPKHESLDWAHPIEISGQWKFPAGKVKFFDTFKESLARRFDMPVIDGTKERVSFDGGISRLHITPGGYRIKIQKGAISVLGEEAEGLLNGLYRLSSLAFVKDGRLLFPSGEIEDSPATTFRGVHLFVGKTARAFQMKLWDRVLRPLMLNKVVLQCEQTAWDSNPGTDSPITMPKAELAKLFEDYRKIEVEPIPLIQSFGHMEWFFRNGKNLHLAYNPLVPYSIDPRKQEAVDRIEKIWDEAFEALKPKTVHFGLDEVDMRGFAKPDPPLVTELWTKLLPELGRIAKKHDAQMMLWGDKGLAPNEAEDAALGDTPEDAPKRRNAIPKGAWIADWHYMPEQEPQKFLKSLQTWKMDGFKAIASTWYQPENIRGFNLAANLEQAGSLQTTWAGYESSEPAMLAQLKQFSSMILTADYSWSGRQERIENLPYNPAELFARIYNPIPSPLSPQPGLTFGNSSEFKVGRYRFGTMEPASLQHIGPGGSECPAMLSWKVMAKSKRLALALSTKIMAEDGEPVADLVLMGENGQTTTYPLIYGLHVRAESDRNPTFYGPSEKGRTVFDVDLGGKPIKQILFVAKNRYVGLTIHGLSFY